MSILYRDTAPPAPPTPPLDGVTHADVAVVGGGITGLSTALHAAEAGAKVVLLEAEDPGFGASGRNGGQVNPGLKLNPDTVERDFGPDLGGRMNALAGAAPSLVFDLIQSACPSPARRGATELCARPFAPNTPPRFVPLSSNSRAAAERRSNIWSAAPFPQ